MITEHGSDAGSALDLVQRGLATASATRAPVYVAVPAPVLAPERVLALAGTEDFTLYSGEDGAVGLGALATLEARGDSRLEDVAQRAAQLGVPEVLATGHRAPPAPRWIGGASFAPGWGDELGDACFVLPRRAYRVHGQRAWWLSALQAGDDAHTSARALGSALAELRRCASLCEPPRASLPPDGRRDGDEARRSAWRAHVSQALEEIGAGRLSKVVAARVVRRRLARAHDAAALLVTLGARAPSCTRFAIRRRGVTFLGATPERLVALHEGRVTSEALAGSAAPGVDLLASRKDREEHRWVVDAITSQLGPLLDELRVAGEPELRVLRHVTHLRTPISGVLRAPGHVLSLAARLHPTPAVGGVPERAALDFIRAHEATPRGWYAGPFGWFDRAGNGELVVALRSGLFRDRDATLYAGAGIVEGSDPDREWDETELKLAALGAALEPAP